MYPKNFQNSVEECPSDMVHLYYNIGTAEVNLFHSFIQRVFVELCAGYCVGYTEVQCIDFALKVVIA